MNDFQAVVNYVMQIRAQELHGYIGIWALVVAAILACVIATVAALRAERRGRLSGGAYAMRLILMMLAVACLGALLVGTWLQSEGRRQFCLKWLANHSAAGKAAPALIQDFSRTYYAIQHPVVDDSLLDTKDLPSVPMWAQVIRYNLVLTLGLPAAAGLLVLLALCVRSREAEDSAVERLAMGLAQELPFGGVPIRLHRAQARRKADKDNGDRTVADATSRLQGM